MSQPSSSSYNQMDYNRHLVTDDGDAFSLPPSSQESIESLHTNGQKRSYDCEDDEELDDTYDELTAFTGITWQSSVRLDPSTRMNSVSGRTILTPTLGQQRQQFGTMARAAIDVDDFEEPAFLRRREEVDMDLS
ncbi:hypothetical protein BBP40_011729 [Aspergillus hancockii]|nr:hypothetical protein BBP40_011729 [Aspergillus hancockii]